MEFQTLCRDAEALILLPREDGSYREFMSFHVAPGTLDCTDAEFTCEENGRRHYLVERKSTITSVEQLRSFVGYNAEAAEILRRLGVTRYQEVA